MLRLFKRMWIAHSEADIARQQARFAWEIALQEGKNTLEDGEQMWADAWEASEKAWKARQKTWRIILGNGTQAKRDWIVREIFIVADAIISNDQDNESTTTLAEKMAKISSIATVNISPNSSRTSLK